MGANQASNLSETVAADRRLMAERIKAIVLSCGASFEEELAGAREISLRVRTTRGLCIIVDFDGQNPQPNVYVMSWFMDYSSTDKLSPDAFGGQVNPSHHRKATQVAYGFDRLCALLKRGLNQAANGRVFQDKEGAPFRQLDEPLEEDKPLLRPSDRP